MKKNKKSKLSNQLSDKTRKAVLIAGGVLITSILAKFLIDMVLKKDLEDHEKAKNEVFDIVSKNCSSLGVNKMAIVDKTSKMIRSERLKRKDADRRVEELEKFILNYNSVSKEEMEDMLQQIKSKNKNNG